MSFHFFPRTSFWIVVCFVGQIGAAELPIETRSAIDVLVTRTLAESLVPSASIAVVKDGQIAYAKAYGLARLEPAVPATESMRYKIASNSKQMTAAAILRLVEMRKLSLDEKVARFYPELTRASHITVRQLLNHTSGYPDYYAPDYLLLGMELPVTPRQIVQRWATQRLDFEPGTRYQYSNTGYVILGQIIEKRTGKPLLDFLRSQFFDRLGMHSVIDVDTDDWSPTDPQGYTRYALGPMRPIKPEGPGWLSAMGELAMTASDLARWNIALAEGKLLSTTSMRALTLAAPLRDGTNTRYALGLNVSQMGNGHRRWGHTGTASGFLSANTNFPDDGVAITVLTNGDGKARSAIASQLEKLLMEPIRNPFAPAALERANALLTGLQKGSYEREWVTDDLAGYFTPQVLSDFSTTLGPLGPLTNMQEVSSGNRGGMVSRTYTVNTATQKLSVETYFMADGRLHQFLVLPN